MELFSLFIELRAVIKNRKDKNNASKDNTARNQYNDFDVSIRLTFTIEEIIS